mgnify:CR=1 FL=1
MYKFLFDKVGLVVIVVLLDINLTITTYKDRFISCKDNSNDRVVCVMRSP